MLTTTAPAATNYTIGLRKALAAIALALAVDCGMSREATAQSTYYTTTGSTGAWNTSRWSTSSGGPFNSAYGSGTAVAFTSGSYQFAGMGATINVGNVSVSNNVNVFFASAGSTYATGGAVQTVDVGTGGVYDLSSQSISTAAGTGFLKSGAGVFATAGNTYTGGFTLNAGTVIVRGVNAMGAGGALTLNGGVVASNANRNLTGKYTGGITVGGNVQFGEFASNVALANDTANLTFDNTMALGASNRTLTLGNRGNVAFGGVIANTSGGITFAAASGADASVSGAGRFDVTNLANTFTGNLTFTGAEVRFSADGSLGNAANDIIINGGRFAIASGSNVTLGASRDIQVGNTAGTSINVPGASGTLTYNNAIADISGQTGSWTKQGSGVLRLGGVSTYTGSTTIANGTTRLTTGNDRLPTGTVLSLGQAASTNRGTLDLGGFNQTVGGLATIVGSSTTVSNSVTTSVGSGTLSINVASGTYTFGDGSDTNSGVISGSISIVKLGAGTQILGGSNAYTGPTTLSAGTLVAGNAAAFGSGAINVNGGTLDLGSFAINNAVNINGGSLANAASYSGATTITGTVALGSVPNSAVTVAAGGVLQGTPTVASLGGAGLVSPGSSPGIVTAGTLDPSGGIDFALEFTGTTPDYGTAGASVNDVIRLTAGSPFLSNLSAGNVVDVYLNVGSIAVNDTYEGGFFTTLSANDLLTALSGATFNFFGKATGGSVTFNGESYNPLTSFAGITGANVSTTSVTANFGAGPVSGSSMQFAIVPEPSSLALAGLGVALAGYAAWRRRRAA
jgi:autotransporter-associated beta strand protein